MEAKFKLKDPSFRPVKQTEGSSGYDVVSEISYVIKPGETALIPLGFSVEVPRGYEVQVRNRSGQARKGIIVANGIGTIDSDYRGTVGMLLFNSTSEPYEISKGDRVGQIVFAKLPEVTIIEIAEELSQTERGSGGFGSTGLQ